MNVHALTKLRQEGSDGPMERAMDRPYLRILIGVRYVCLFGICVAGGNAAAPSIPKAGGAISRVASKTAARAPAGIGGGVMG